MFYLSMVIVDEPKIVPGGLGFDAHFAGGIGGNHLDSAGHQRVAAPGWQLGAAVFKMGHRWPRFTFE